MARSQLRVYYGPQSETHATISETTQQKDVVSVPLAEIFPLLADAVRSERTWLRDFEDDEITISTDLYARSMNAALKDMTTLMSKFLCLGVPLADVVAMSTWAPAQAIGRPDLGHLDVGAGADVAEVLDHAGGVARMESFARLYAAVELFVGAGFSGCNNSGREFGRCARSNARACGANADSSIDAGGNGSRLCQRQRGRQQCGSTGYPARPGSCRRQDSGHRRARACIGHNL